MGTGTATPPDRERVAVDPLAPEEAPAAAPRRAAALGPGGRARVVIALAFLFAPVLVVLAGHAGGPLAREQRVPPPRLAQGWTGLDDGVQYLVQRLPLRGRAVDANTWISKHVFGTTPRYGTGASGDAALPFGLHAAGGGYAQSGGAAATHPIVAVGRDGWLFLQGELDITCHPPIAPVEAARRWERFVREIRASGRRVALLVVPEKSTIYPEHVKPATISWTCAQRQKARLWREIERLRDPDVLPLRSRLLALKRRHPRRLTYLRLNSHWNDVGALELVRSTVEHVGRGVRVRARDLHEAPKLYPSDLTAFAGLGTKQERAPGIAVIRPGDDTARSVLRPYGATTTRSGPPGTDLPGTTLVLHDSFGFAPAPMLQHYARHLVLAYLTVLKPAAIPGLIRDADTVVIETSERDFLNRAAAGLDQTILTPGFLRDLPRQIGARPPLRGP